ncbi:MAG TPA: phosphoribosylaminoimidazolesuccinocarboxamide synthase [Acidimicrobiales bacterium]|nr:phosphoribosylaminoimidazolesuccinocarboxamide synthase [Acidimicrobiales bacterium]
MTLALTHLYRGKVRDLYEVDDDALLLVASDRLSAFDVVMAEPIPDKGRVLTGLTDYWVDRASGAVPASLLSCDPAEIERVVPGFLVEREWHGRAMLARRAEMLNLECIVRARLAGQAFDEYAERGTVHGEPAPRGMRLTDPFERPRFTPSTKEEAGHDRNVSRAEAARLVGADVLEAAEALSLALFDIGAAAAAAAGLVLADTKFELGWVDGALVVCDEVMTPDSSRLWPADAVRSGETPPSFDKQPFRDWLAGLAWDRTPPPPRVPDDVVAVTAARYRECYERVTGASLDDWYGAPA